MKPFVLPQRPSSPPQLDATPFAPPFARTGPRAEVRASSAPAPNNGAPVPDRAWLCAACGAVERAPGAGGPVTCSMCRSPSSLPDRRAHAWRARPPQPPSPGNEAARLQHLRMQDGRPRAPSPTLMAVLGGPRISFGREREALLIWHGLHARSARGDVAASEDLTTLTLMAVYHPFVAAQPGLAEALAECALDATVLPRHKTEQLGLLVRLAVGRGDRARALRYLSWMAPDEWELEADSDFRVSAAAVVTLDRDARRVLELVGMRKDAIPIADSSDPLASVLRANAYELLGELATAEHILGELPDPALLDAIRARFPAVRLCERAGYAFAERAKRDGAHRAAKGAGFLGRALGRGLLFGGIPCIVLPLLEGGAAGRLWSSGTLISCAIGVLLTAAGGASLLHARGAEARAARLWTTGIELRARVIAARPTGTRVNDVPMVELSLRVDGPRGPYDAKVETRVPEYEIASLLGAEVRVRADPGRLEEVVLDGRG